MTTEPPSRTALRSAKRVIVKAGTSIVTNENGTPSLTRLGAITEQISELVKSGKEVIFVSSGAVGMGKRLLRKQKQLNLSLKDLHQAHEGGSTATGGRGPGGGGLSASSSFLNLLEPITECPEQKKQYDSACAAAGQFEMMNFYSSLFGQCDIVASQILVTQADFQDEFRLKNLTYAIDRLLSLGVVPIVNENDAVSANTGYTEKDIFSDNDSLAGICARNFNADVLLMLTDVEGVYDKPPSVEGAKLLKFYAGDEDVAIGEKSMHGKWQIVCH